MDIKVKQGMGNIDEQIKRGKDYMDNKLKQGMYNIDE